VRLSQTDQIEASIRKSPALFGAGLFTHAWCSTKIQSRFNDEFDDEIVNLK